MCLISKLDIEFFIVQSVMLEIENLFSRSMISYVCEYLQICSKQKKQSSSRPIKIQDEDKKGNHDR